MRSTKAPTKSKTFHVLAIFVHLGIFVSYITASCTQFVLGSQPNPIGTGLKQWALFLLHLFITSAIMLAQFKIGNRKEVIDRFVVSHFLPILLGMAVYMLFSNAIWGLLWKLRGQ